MSKPKPRKQAQDGEYLNSSAGGSGGFSKWLFQVPPATWHQKCMRGRALDEDVCLFLSGGAITRVMSGVAV